METLRGDVEELSTQNQCLRMELQQSMAEKDHQQQQFLIQMGNLEKGLKQQIQQLEVRIIPFFFKRGILNLFVLTGVSSRFGEESGDGTETRK